MPKGTTERRTTASALCERGFSGEDSRVVVVRDERENDNFAENCEESGEATTNGANGGAVNNEGKSIKKSCAKLWQRTGDGHDERWAGLRGDLVGDRRVDGRGRRWL